MRDRLKVNRVSEILGIKVSFSHETKFEAAALLKEFSSSTEIRSVCRNILSDAVAPPPPPPVLLEACFCPLATDQNQYFLY